MAQASLKLALVGDVFLERENPEAAFDHVADIFASADAVIGNSEGVYSDEVSYPPPAIHQMVAKPSMVNGLAAAKFAAMSVANNHTVDGGHVGLLNSLELMRAKGIKTAGGGSDINEARAPAIFEANGKRIGLLSYTSVMPKGYEARPHIPGVAPLRVDTCYDAPDPNMWLPGYAARIRTLHWANDLAAMVDDVKRVRPTVDHLLVSVHQGNSQAGGFLIDEYERVAARTAIDAGADFFAALGHHHSLRGAEFYQGKPIFYGLGNFMFDLLNLEKHFSPELMASWRARFGENAFGPREGYPTYPFPTLYRITAIGVIAVDASGKMRAGFVPAEVQPDGRPRPYKLDTEDGRRVADYIAKCMNGIGSDWALRPAVNLLGDHDVLEIVPA